MVYDRLPSPRVLIIVFIGIFAIMSFLGINIKEIIISNINYLFSIQSTPNNMAIIPVTKSPSSYYHDDGILIHDNNKITLSHQEKMPPATSEWLIEDSPDKNAKNNYSLTPTISKILNKRDTNNKINVFPSNSFSSHN
jgi:hypothetical protein